MGSTQKLLRFAFIFSILYNLSGCSKSAESNNQDPEIKIVPLPSKMLLREGSMRLTDDFWVIANVGNPVTAELAEVLVASLESLTSKNVGITDLYSTRKHKQSILLEIKNNYTPKQEEAYSIEMTSSHIKIISGTGSGLFWGIQSLLQILKSTSVNGDFIIQKMNIKDQPTNAFRGVLLNPNRYEETDFSTIIKTFARYKLNQVLLTEEINESWSRINIFDNSFINTTIVTQIPNELTLISYGISREEMERIFESNRNSSDTKGLLLDLTSTTLEDIETKVTLASELGWSNNTNREFNEIRPDY